jgi:hypothetical protein
MIAQKINVVQGDNNIKLIFNIKKDNNVESILGATIDLQFKNILTNDIIKRQCVVTEPSSGECMYTLTTEDTAIVGTYRSELAITYANGTKLTYLQPFTLNIHQQLVEG